MFRRRRQDDYVELAGTSGSDNSLEASPRRTEQPEEGKEKNPGCWKMWNEFPKTVFAIFGNEFCERFSFYGMRTVLTLYFVSILGYSNDQAVANFHGFIVICYFSPIFGSILADGFIGKFHTILWVSLLYASGNVILAIAAYFPKGHPVHPNLDWLGLGIIGIGTGGIKPCVSAFGGDQFKKGQDRLLESFFAVFYFSINAGATLSTFISPLLRATPCLGQETCFPAAFGLPAVLMIISVIFFVSGSRWYRKYPPKENVIWEVTKATGKSMRNRIRNGNTGLDHWLDHYFDDHDCSIDPKCAESCQKKQFIEDIKAFFRVCVMFIPVPMFWALYDQQGSRWVLQAVGMNGRIFNKVCLLPDQMGTLNAIMIMVFIPIFQGGVYPLVRKCGINPTPLRRMVVGGFLAAFSFVIAMFVQFAVNKTLPRIPDSTSAHLSFINTFPCSVHLHSLNDQGITSNISVSANSTFFIFIHMEGRSKGLRWELSGPCLKPQQQNITTSIASGESWYTILSYKGIKTFKSNLKKSEKGEGEFKMSTSTKDPSKCYPRDEENFEAFVSSSENASQYLDIKPRQWRLYRGAGMNDSFMKMKEISPEYMGFNFTIGEQGGIYTLTLTDHGGQKVKTLQTIAAANSVSILWQIPQYLSITAAEILFSITGLEFSYSQAPHSMKSCVQAAWLLTVAFGDLIDFVLAEAPIFQNVAYVLLLFAALMAIVTGILMILSIFWYKYKYYTQEGEEKQGAVGDENPVYDPHIDKPTTDDTKPIATKTFS